MDRFHVGPRSSSILVCLIVACALAASLVAAPAAAQEAAERSAERTDLISWLAGAFAVRLDAPASNSTVRVPLDGNPRTLDIGIPRREPLPHRFVVELPALTTFDTFAVPVIDEFGSARGRHVRTVVIEGSTEGPDSGFAPLATLNIELGRNAPQHFAVPDSRPVRWLRVQFLDRLIDPPADYDPHVFSELIGYGMQEPIVVPPDRFTGRWRYRRTGINFDVDSDVLRADAAPALERVLAALQATGSLNVRIEGHTDSDGSEEHNLDLSQRRAESVVSWLVERGIDRARLEPVGRGESSPIADNESSAGRALNRRVEVRSN